MAKPDLRDNRKFLKLRRLLGEPTPHVIGYLECLWNRGYQTGNPLIGDGLDVEAAAEYPGEPEKFARAAHAAGFLDTDLAGNYTIHDLFEHAPKYAKQRMHRVGTAPKPVTSVPKTDDIEHECDTIGDEVGTENPDMAHVRQECATKPITENRKPKTKNRKPRTSKIPLAAVAADGEAKPPAVDEKAALWKPLFAAVADVTGLDPGTASTLIGKVTTALRDASPPYSPGEVRAFAVRFGEFCPWGPKSGRHRPEPIELQTHIGKIRASPPRSTVDAVESTMRLRQQDAEERARAASAGEISALFGNFGKEAPP